jgi:DNA-binding NtrC family response regulator
MIEKEIHIVLVEDDRDHAALIQRSFHAHSRPVRLTITESLQQAKEYLHTLSFDVIITDLILPEHLPAELLRGRPAHASTLGSSPGQALPISLKEAERSAIAEALTWAGGNKSKAARVLGITRQTLRQKIKVYGMVDKYPPG